jgi:hypothetical protein
MSAQAVPCEVPTIKRNIASGWKQTVRGALGIFPQ